MGWTIMSEKPKWSGVQKVADCHENYARGLQRTGSVEMRRPKRDAAILLKSPVKAVGLLVSEFAVCISPFSKELLQLPHFTCELVQDLILGLMARYARLDPHSKETGHQAQ